MPHDSSGYGWTSVSVDERLAALEELFLYLAATSSVPSAGGDILTDSLQRPSAPLAGVKEQGRGARQSVWVGADGAWIALRQHVLSELTSTVIATPLPASPVAQDDIYAPSALAQAMRRACAPAVASEEDDSMLVSSRKSMERTSHSDQLARRVQQWLQEERQRACLFASIGQHVTLNAQRLRALSVLSLRGCGLAHVSLRGMHSLAAIDLSDNASLQRIECLEQQEQLHTLLLHRNPMLCAVDALTAAVSPLLQVHVCT